MFGFDSIDSCFGLVVVDVCRDPRGSFGQIFSCSLELIMRPHGLGFESL